MAVFEVVEGDITKLEINAIMNATNSSLLKKERLIFKRPPLPAWRSA